MGRKSTKENKNVYQTSRESLGLTRESAAVKLQDSFYEHSKMLVEGHQ